jgi:hypothetical protein
MTREQIAAKIAEQTAKKGQEGSEKRDYMWKPPVGKSAVRIVPSLYKREELFTELLVHYGIGNKSMWCLSNFGEKDPILEMAEHLKKTEDWKLGYKLEPRKRVFIPIIVRGEESKGVRLWEFGKNTFLDILRLMDDEDLDDITDPMVGRDIILDTTSPEQNGSSYNNSSVKLKAKSTKLSDDAAQVKLWLENQPNPISRYPKVSYSEMKEALRKHLTPESEATDEAASEDKSDLPWENGKEPNKYSLNTGEAKKTVGSARSKEVDDLFKI